MELQERHRDLARAGADVFAVSYDPVPILASFAERYGITYALLSDEGSRMIRSLGLLNTHIDEQAAHYGRPVEEHHRGVRRDPRWRSETRGRRKCLGEKSRSGWSAANAGRGSVSLIDSATTRR